MPDSPNAEVPDEWIVFTNATFSKPLIIDASRPGGEPVIAALPDGTLLVAAHGGMTQFSPANNAQPLVQGYRGEAPLWLSEDDGQSWQYVEDALGRRGNGVGYSDPDLAVDGLGRVWLADLLPFNAVSVTGSSDGGRNWELGGIVPGVPYADRPWLAADGEGVYFTASSMDSTYTSGRSILYSTDGSSWAARGDAPCEDDLVWAGTLFQACYGFLQSRGGGVALFSNGSWQVHDAEAECFVCEPAVTPDGTVYYAGVHGEGLTLIHRGLADDDWNEIRLTEFFPDLAEGLAVWPWTSAGSNGRVSVTFLGSPNGTAMDSHNNWWMYNVIVILNGERQEVWATRLTAEPFHSGPICSGTLCQAVDLSGEPRALHSDRRLGELFETTVTPSGKLAVVYTNTAAYPDHSVGHVAFQLLEEGPSLIDEDVPSGFPTQG